MNRCEGCMKTIVQDPYREMPVDVPAMSPAARRVDRSRALGRVRIITDFLIGLAAIGATILVVRGLWYGFVSLGAFVGTSCFNWSMATTFDKDGAVLGSFFLGVGTIVVPFVITLVGRHIKAELWP